MPTIKDLRRRHPTFDVATTGSLRSLYEGGASFKVKLHEFLPQRPFEPNERYQLRVKEAHYRNYIGPIIDFFTALLFSSRPVAVAESDGEPVTDPGEFWDKFRDDADGLGGDVDAVFKELLTDAMVEGRSWLRVHTPDNLGVPAETLQDFEERKLGEAWVEPIDSVRVLDWEHSDSGHLDWVLIHRKTSKRAGLESARDVITETWEHITREEIREYSITYEANKPPSETEEVALKSTVAHGFSRVPVVCLELPIGLHVASRLETPQLAHFRLSNAQTWGMTATCYAMPVFKVKSPEQFQKTALGAGFGFYIHPEESVEWTAPDAAPFAALSEEISSQKDEIFRIAHQMALGVENNAAAVGRSGESKQQDALQTKVVLLAFSRIVKEAIEVVYDLISGVRGESYTWSIEGLDDFASADIYGLLDALKTLKDVGGIQSNTFNAEMQSRLADALLPDLAQKTKQDIKNEIKAGVKEAAESESELNGMVREFQKQNLQQPPQAPKSELPKAPPPRAA